MNIKLIDAATLLNNLIESQKHFDFEDIDRTYEMMVAQMDKRIINYPTTIVESALWASNLLNEEGKFRDPLGRSFNAVVKNILGKGGKTFHPFFNTIEEK